MSRRDGALGALLAMMWPTLFGLLAILLSLAPIGLAPEASPAPNLLLATLYIWVARQPAACPPLLVFLLGAIADLAMDGPVGAELMALLIVTEAVRADVVGRPAYDAGAAPLGEWGRFAAAALAHATLTAAILIVTLAAPPVWALLERALWTVLAYPAVMLGVGWLLGVRAEPGRLGLPDR